MTSAPVRQQTVTQADRRESLRDKGQFWTPDWIALAMVKYVLTGSSPVFDPASGKGAFYNALTAINCAEGTTNSFYGTDIDPQLVNQLREDCSGAPNHCNIELRDFIQDPPTQRFASIVANPPYIRHHRLSEQVKQRTRQIARQTIGKPLDGRAGIHVYFLIQALTLLERDGKLAFIMPSDTSEGVFSSLLWSWITANYCLECVVTFTPAATPFPKIDTNPIIFLIKRAPPTPTLVWVQVTQPETKDLTTFVASHFTAPTLSSLRIANRDLQEALATGLSKDPESRVLTPYSLSNFATVMRGIATGANEFFFLTTAEAQRLQISPEFLLPAIGRTRDITSGLITNETIADLDKKGRPTLLFALDGRPIGDFPAHVQEYIRQGERNNLPHKTLISSRKPWYKMERRSIPPFLFAYLGRRNTRFIRNLAGVLPLTGFLCVYPRSTSSQYIDALWTILQHPDTIKNLNLIGKSYGAGAIKIEPRALERLPLSEALVHQVGLASGMSHQIAGNTVVRAARTSTYVQP